MSSRDGSGEVRGVYQGRRDYKLTSIYCSRDHFLIKDIVSLLQPDVLQYIYVFASCSFPIGEISVVGRDILLGRYYVEKFHLMSDY